MSVNAWSLAIWLHVLAGTVWVGLLYYFSLIQIPATIEAQKRKNSAELNAINTYLMPRLLKWSKWSALVAWLTGLITLKIMGVGILNAFSLQAGVKAIGMGSWLGTIMLAILWFIILPNYQKILNVTNKDKAELLRANQLVQMASQLNVILSIPMLMCMVGHGHGLPI